MKSVIETNKDMRKNKLTEGPILKNLILFSLPMMAGNLLQQVYNITDTLVVGRFVSANALAAVGSSYTLMVFLTSLIIGLCMGSGALFSMHNGANDEKHFREDLILSFFFIGALTVLIYTIIYPGMDVILHLLQTPEEIYPLAKSYVRIVFIGISMLFLYNFFAYFMRSKGDSVSPLVFLAGSTVLNISLDLLLVIKFEQGVVGTAIATVAAQAFAGIGMAIYALIKERKMIFKKADEKIRIQRLPEIIQNDIMTGLQQSVMNFGILMIQGLVNSFGTTIMAAFAAAVKIDSLAMLSSGEFANAYSLFISQNVGAKKPDRIKRGTKLSFLTSGLFCIFISAIVFMTAGFFVRQFVDPSETEIIYQGVRYLRIEGSCYFGIGFLQLFYGYFRGIKKPWVSLILTIVSLGTRVLLSYTLAPNTFLQVVAIWMSIPIGWILADITGYIFMKGFQKKEREASNGISYKH